MTASAKSHAVFSPKLQMFNGEDDKKDTPYEAWKYEVQTLMKEGVYSGSGHQCNRVCVCGQGHTSATR